MVVIIIKSIRISHNKMTLKMIMKHLVRKLITQEEDNKNLISMPCFSLVQMLLRMILMDSNRSRWIIKIINLVLLRILIWLVEEKDTSLQSKKMLETTFNQMLAHFGTVALIVVVLVVKSTTEYTDARLWKSSASCFF